MQTNYILSSYIENAIEYAEYEKLDDGSYCGKIPLCKGVIAFGANLAETSRLLRSTLEDWVLLGLRLSHDLPVINGIDLNVKIEMEKYETV
ncbi:MAG: type II toxin-antitoxin system HicB family antitoxin [Ignavibacteriae bacterium]|nr:type II toxin-antitoxin system HicB family antitoxin [Ignavibacteriota bacterium]